MAALRPSTIRPIPLFLIIASLAIRASAADSEPAEDPFTPAEYADAVQKTVGDRTVHAELGPVETPLAPALSNFLLDHPDLSAFIVNRGPRRSLADDGDGTSGLVNLLERTETRRLYYGEGVHRSRVFPDVRATAVIIMRLRPAVGPDSRPATITSFEVYVRMRSRFVSRVVKTLRPFLQRTVIGKFSKAFLVADQVGRLIARDPAAVAADAKAFPGIADEDLADLLRLSAALGPPRSSPR